MNKLYSVHDHWTDINKKNDVDIESIDGVITGIKVNGEDCGGGGLKTKEVNLYDEYPNIKSFIDNLADDQLTSTNLEVNVDSIFTTEFYIGVRDIEPYKTKVDKSRHVAGITGTYDGTHVNLTSVIFYSWGLDKNSRPILIIPESWEITNTIINNGT